MSKRDNIARSASVARRTGGHARAQRAVMWRKRKRMQRVWHGSQRRRAVRPVSNRPVLQKRYVRHARRRVSVSDDRQRAPAALHDTAGALGNVIELRAGAVGAPDTQRDAEQEQRQRTAAHE